MIDVDATALERTRLATTLPTVTAILTGGDA
jgi:hypothetical protein